ncbi:lymphocyte cytosolic protein 2 isoform X3 [Bubalus bubalis]|uniref:lymphocyte cytosolic protein 2 isoform X3 n=1 Tax=Bubalus bubalis TaxID=89462 RepID=UPI001E1B6FED|nr:lymphocyte cytosolic protein 2 isoform X3 [Bubalus bubalis]
MGNTSPSVYENPCHQGGNRGWKEISGPRSAPKLLSRVLQRAADSSRSQRILSKLSQEINKNEERRSIFTRKPQVQRFPEETESHEEDNGGWSSFEEDDYESPNDDADAEDDGDYESPNEEEEAPAEDDADYEPPPSNDEEALQNSILPAKPLSNPNSMYIDRPPTGKVQQPPVPPQRPMPSLPPLPAAGRIHQQPLPPPQPNHEEPSRSRNHKTAKLPAPSIDRSTKPALDRSLVPFDREPFTLGKKPVISDKPSVLGGRPPGEHFPKIQKPPLPPATERHDRGSPLPGKKPPVPRHMRGPERRENDEDDVHQRLPPQPSPLPMTSNTFPSRSTKPSPKNSLPLTHSSGAFSESNTNFPQSASLPPYFSQGPGNRPLPRMEGRNFSPVPSKPRPQSPGEEENSLNEDWYVSYITRTEAEAALRKINQESHSIKRKLFPPNFQHLTSCIFLLTPNCHPQQCGRTHIETDSSNLLSFSLEISNCHLILKVLNLISCLPVLNTNLKPIYQRYFTFRILHILRLQQKSWSLKLGGTFIFFLIIGSD